MKKILHLICNSHIDPVWQWDWDEGATTFFEDFDLSWAKDTARIDEFAKESQHDLHRDFGKYCYLGYRHSLCHGWSAGVIKFIKEHC